ncbi:MAG: ABC transporter ATP-binding protein/permease [Chloroflexota bacterium]|nr:ABC transporter ATP-binding protein/permease [Chloroflexota bacterium]
MVDGSHQPISGNGRPRGGSFGLSRREQRRAESGAPPPGAGNGTPAGDGNGEGGPGLRVVLREARRNARASLVGVPRVLKLVWDTHRGFTLAMGIVTLLQSALPAAQVWIAGQLLQAVTDGLARGGDDVAIRRIVLLAAIQFGLLAGSSLLDTLRNITQQLLQDRTANRVQLMIMEHANGLDLTFFEDAKFYDQLQQAQREAAFRPVGMVSGVFGLVRTLLTFLTMIALLVRLGPLLAIVALLAPIPAFISSTRYGWQGYQQMRRQSPERRLMGYLTNLLTTDTYNKEIKLFTLGDFFVGRYRQLSAKYIREHSGLMVRRYLAGFVWGALTILASSGTYLYVALQAVRGRIDIAGLVVYTQAAQQVQQNFQGLLGGLSGMYENTLYLNTLFDLLAFEPRIRAPESPVPVAARFERGIEFRGVTYTYPGREEPALRDISFTIAPRETVALVGRNGAGKTTIVKLLTRLYDPDEGQILIDGVDIRDYDPAALRREIGVIFQDYVTYYLSASDNIGVGRLEELENRARIESSAGQSGADEVVARLPEGYDTTLGKWFDQGHQLSGGEWQKIALARAFMRDAQILILDEPTAALDAQAEYEIFARMQELTVDKTALFISHRFSTVRLADRIMVLEGGRIIEDGAHDELLLRGGRYAELFNLQAASYR